MEVYINEIVAFVQQYWLAIGGTMGGLYGTWKEVQRLYYKFKYGGTKQMYQQAQTFKKDTEDLVNSLKETQVHLQSVAKLTYELGVNANILKEGKLKMQEIIKSITNDFKAIPEDVIIKMPEITQEIQSNNENISDILAKL